MVVPQVSGVRNPIPGLARSLRARQSGACEEQRQPQHAPESITENGPESVGRAGETAIVFGHGILVAGRDLRWVGVADSTALLFVKLAAKLEFEGIDLADQFLVHLLHESRVAGEAARIEVAHLLDERLEFGARFGAVLDHGTNAAEGIESLIDFVLRIGWIGALLRCDGLALNVRVASILAAEERAAAIACAASWLPTGPAILLPTPAAWLPPA